MLFIPSFILFIECVAACLPSRRQQGFQHPLGQFRVDILVPAHNEAPLIAKTLDNLKTELTQNDRLIVIADNCTDQTAEIARHQGVIVLDRQDERNKGKGYALDFALQVIAKDPPDVVVVVDADCYVSSGSIALLSQKAYSFRRPAQATYLMQHPDQPRIKDLISAFALKLKNLVRLLGVTRLRGPALLTGSGMALPWDLLSHVSLAGDKTVDDMQLAIDCALAGYPPLFVPDALVIGRLMEHQAAQSQRSRWEHGHLEVILTQVPRLVQAAVQQRRWGLLAMALDLSVPPLSLLVVLWLVLWMSAIMAMGFGVSVYPAIIVAMEGALLGLSIAGVWVKFGQVDLPAKSLLSIPIYLLWKLPIYLQFLIKPQTRWLATERDAAESASQPIEPHPQAAESVSQPAEPHPRAAAT